MCAVEYSLTIFWIWLTLSSSYLGYLFTLVNILPNLIKGLSLSYISDYIILSLNDINKVVINYILLLTITLLYLNFIRFKSNKILLIFFLILNTMLIPSYISDTERSSCLSKDTVNLLEIPLISGILNIHPVLLSFSYIIILFIIMWILIGSNLIFIYSRLVYKFKYSINFNLGLNNLAFSKNNLLIVRVTSMSAISMLLFSIILGAYWSYQEVNWGGYWSWDPVEIFSLFSLVYLLFVSHFLSINTLRIGFILLSALFLLFIGLTRINLLNSIHGFLISQESLYRLNYFFIFIFFSILYSIFVLASLRSVDLNTTWYRFSKLIITLISVIFILTISYLFISIASSVMLGDLVSVQLQKIPVIIYTLLLVFILNNVTIVSLILPLLDANIIFRLYNIRNFVFFLKYYHFILLTTLLFFISYSHNTVALEISFNFDNDSLFLLNMLIFTCYGIYDSILDYTQSNYSGFTNLSGFNSLSLFVGSMNYKYFRGDKVNLSYNNVFIGYDRVFYLDYSYIKINLIFIVFLIYAILFIIFIFKKNKNKVFGY